ncbi:MAG: porin family protein [Bacteroidales bacterium]
MKKTLVFITAFLINTPIFAQDSMPTQEFVLGFRAGGNYSSMIFGTDFDYTTVSPKFGFNVGAVARFDLVYTPIDFEMGILYSRKGAKAEGENFQISDYIDFFDLSRNYQLDYIDIPIIVNLSTSSIKRNWQIYAGGGIMVSLGSKGKITEAFTSDNYELDFSNSVVWGDSPEAHFHKSDLSYIGQLGFKFNKSLEVNVSISKSLVNIDPNNDFIKNSTMALSIVKVINRKYVR